MSHKECIIPLLLLLLEQGFGAGDRIVPVCGGRIQGSHRIGQDGGPFLGGHGAVPPVKAGHIIPDFQICLGGVV